MASLHIFQLTGFLLGLLFGSFLNVCISRLPKHESVVSPGSRCPTCGHAIRWYDNVPLLSWMILGGRCRDCKAAIEPRYPMVELLLGLWFVRQASLISFALSPALDHQGYRAPLMIDAVSLAIFGFLLIGLLVMDWQTQRLPDAFTLTGIASGLFLVCVQAIFLGPTDDQIVLSSTHQLRLSSPGSFAARGNVFLTGPESLIFGRLAAVVGAALLLLAVRWGYRAARKREGMGLGDVKLLAMIAAFLGFTQSMLALFLGVFAASLYAITLLARHRAGGATRLPLGSFLAMGGLAAALWGQSVVAWYAGLLH